MTNLRKDLLVAFLVVSPVKDAFNLMNESGELLEIIPEFDGCNEVRHDSRPGAHHYGETIAEHTADVLDRAEKIGASPELKLALLFHDIGKIYTRAESNGKVHFYNHETVSASIARRRLTWLAFESSTIDYVTTMVLNHMRVHQLVGKEGDSLRKSAARLFIDLNEDYRLATEILQHGECDAGNPGSTVEIARLFESFRSVFPLVTAVDVEQYDKEIRSDLLKQLRFFQLSQGLDYETLMKQSIGEAHNLVNQRNGSGNLK